MHSSDHARLPEGRYRVVFLSGTRADFGKIKPLLRAVEQLSLIDLRIFVTGMHMLQRYGYTCEEIERSGFKNLHKFINQNANDRMDQILAKTIMGLSDYVRETNPHLIVVHGDRVETLAGAAVGALNNTLVAHIEGGEVSGTVDELLRHSVTKLAHLHFVANDAAKARLIQLGEREDSIYVIGSPDIDAMESPNLPTLPEVRARYGIKFDPYALLLFHPVTSEVGDLRRQAREIAEAAAASGRNFVVIHPNNDHGTDLIFDEFDRLRGNPRFRFFPSVRFEYFLTLMKNAAFVIGNSSAGVREAPHYGVPSINLGSRQRNRATASTIVHCPVRRADIETAIKTIDTVERVPMALFGQGRSAELFRDAISDAAFWNTKVQKLFVDRH